MHWHKGCSFFGSCILNSYLCGAHFVHLQLMLIRLACLQLTSVGFKIKQTQKTILLSARQFLHFQYSQLKIRLISRAWTAVFHSHFKMGLYFPKMTRTKFAYLRVSFLDLQTHRWFRSKFIIVWSLHAFICQPIVCFSFLNKWMSFLNMCPCLFLTSAFFSLFFWLPYLVVVSSVV